MKGQCVLPCSIGGRCRTTGRKTGSRHRWKGGNGRCLYCGKALKQVIGKKKIENVDAALMKMGFEI
jgi:hypothetical protein